MRSSGSPSRRFLYLLGCVVALGCSQISETNAQEVRLRPQARLYSPTRISIQDGILQLRQKIGLLVGARLTLAFSDRFQVATGVTYIPGYAEFRGARKRLEFATGSHQLSVATGVQYWLIPALRALSWEVHTGFGVVFGGQPPYDDLFGSSTLSGILGTTLAYRIGRIVRLQLRIQERLCRFRFGAQGLGGSKPPLQVSFGLGFPFLESTR